MNNRSAQSAGGPRAAQTFVVDLTSVCLRSGTVRLPLSLIGRFSEGQHKVTAGGEELIIEFEAPRTLLGLAPFFERTELKANDRVQFVFDGQHLELSAQKRERSRASRPAGPPLHAGSNVTAAAETGGQKQGRTDARLTSRGLFPAPAELVDVTAEQTEQTASEAGAEPAEAAAHTESDQWRGASVNAVRRVRIEGGLPPRADTATPRPLDRASAHDVWAHRQQAAWRSLDTTIAGPVVPPEEAAEAYSETTVRVVRRSKGTSTPLEVEAPPLPKPEPELPAEEHPKVSYSMSWPLPETRRNAPPARPADGPPSKGEVAGKVEQEPAQQPEERSQRTHQAAQHTTLPAERAQLDPYLDAPIDAAREADYTPPTILESDLLSIPSGGKWRTESEEAYLKYQEAQVAAAPEPVAVPAERRQGLLGRLGLGRAARAPSQSESGGAGAPRQAAPTPPPTASPSRGEDSEDAAPDAPDAHAASAQETAPPGAPDYSDKVRVEVTAPTATEPEKRVIVDESVYDVDFDTEVQPHLLAPQDGVVSLETDMANLRRYLSQPDVPAIVRCDDLAERLQMSQERVNNAMLRLSEDREQYTPLRGDAYMVRRVR